MGAVITPHATPKPWCRGDGRSYLSLCSKDSVLSIGSVGSVLYCPGAHATDS